ncbi:MAG: hypothetical protein GY751_02745 [Bacteroidetes bacterium]|nr:hypothetical protein [Bacteroidota bacterium]
MNIIELLKLRGLDETAKIKLVRHQANRYRLNDYGKRLGQLMKTVDG